MQELWIKDTFVVRVPPARHSLRLCKSPARRAALKILAWKRILQLIFFPRSPLMASSTILIHFVEVRDVTA